MIILHLRTLTCLGPSHHLNALVRCKLEHCIILSCKSWLHQERCFSSSTKFTKGHHLIFMRLQCTENILQCFALNEKISMHQAEIRQHDCINRSVENNTGNQLRHNRMFTKQKRLITKSEFESREALKTHDDKCLSCMPYP